MRLPALAPLLCSAALLAGCGGGKGSEPASTPTAAKPSTTARGPVDVRWVLHSDGSRETVYGSPADPAVQRIVLRNATRRTVVLTGSSRSGKGATSVPPGRSKSISWPRGAGRDVVRSAVRVKGERTGDSSSTPVDG